MTAELWPHRNNIIADLICGMQDETEETLYYMLYNETFDDEL